MIDKLADNMDENQTELAMDVRNFEKEVDVLEKNIRDITSGLPPLAKITDMLERWSREPVHTQKDIMKFAHELWVSLDDYEREMRDQVQGHQILLAMKEHQFSTHTSWLKNKFGFYLEVYDQALLELKLRNRREVEQFMMTACEEESRIFNY
jgi:hypothetical protein